MAKSSHVIDTEGRRGTSVYNNIKMQNPFKVIDLETFFFLCITLVETPLR